MALVIVCAMAAATVSFQGADADTAADTGSTGAEDFLALADGGSIVLDNDYVLTTALVITREVEIDLAGHQISNGASAHTIEVAEGGDLTVTDSVGGGSVTNTSDGKAAVYNAGTAVLNGGTFTRASGTEYYVIQNEGTMTIGDGVSVVRDTDTQDSSLVANAPKGPATMTITGGTFTCGPFIAVINHGDGVLNISGGTFSPSDAKQSSVQNWGKATISGGTFTAGVYSMSSDDDASELTITDGTFSNKIWAWNFVDGYMSGDEPASNAAKVTITGGTFNCMKGYIGSFVGGTTTSQLGTTDPSVAVVTISGGDFKANVSQFLADDATMLYTNSRYVVTEDVSSAIAKTGGLYFLTLSDALTKAEAGSDIVLLADCEVSSSITVKAHMDIDLAGHAIVGELSTRLINTFNKTVTVTDSVGGGCILNYGTGASIESNDDEPALTIEAGIYSSDVSAYVADGKDAYEYGGFYVVSIADAADAEIIINGVPFATIEDSLDLINAGAESATFDGTTLTLLRDFDDSAYSITLNTDIVIDGKGHTLKGVITLDAESDGGLYSVTVRDLVMDGDGTLSWAFFGQNQGDGVRPVELTLEDVSVSNYTKKGVYLTNVSKLDVSGCSFNDNATAEQTSTVGDYAFDLNLCGVTDVEIRIVGTYFGGESGGNGPIKITQRGGVGLTDDTASDITSAKSASIRTVTIEDCVFDVTGSKVGDIIVGSSPNADGTCRTYCQSYDLYIEGTAATVAYRGAVVDGDEQYLRIVLDSTDAFDADGIDGGISMLVKGDVEMYGTIRPSIEVVSLYSVTVPESKHLTGTVMFGSDAANGANLNDVTGGQGGLVMSLGSVVLSGNAESGSISIVGHGLAVGKMELGSASLSIPEGSSFSIGRDASLTGSGSVVVAGEMNVYGIVDMYSVTNTGSIVLYEDGDIVPDVTGDEPVKGDAAKLIIYQISTLHADVGEIFRVAVAVSDPDAKITATGADWLQSVDGRVISGTPDKVGTYTITVTAESEGITTQMSFDVVVGEPADEDDGDGFDWRIVVLVIIGIIAVILILRAILG